MFKNETDFEKIISRLNIDTKPNPAHRENLQRQMLSAFGKTHLATNATFFWRTIIKRLAAAAAVTAAVIIGMHYIKPDFSTIEIWPRCETHHIKPNVSTMKTMGEANLVSTPREVEGLQLVALDIKLPKAMFVGTPQDIRVPNLEKPLGKPRPPFLAPAGTKNVALGKPVYSSDEEPIIGKLELITDDDKEAADGCYVELGPSLQHITIDLKAMYEIYAIVFWHYHKQPRVYFDVIVQVADDADFITNVRTLFNNDIDNSAGLGAGKDMHYVETYEGKLIDAKGQHARYVRLYSNGNNNNTLNHYTEVAVYGLPVK